MVRQAFALSRGHDAVGLENLKAEDLLDGEEELLLHLNREKHIEKLRWKSE
jgi:hypothetical protein